MNTHTALALAAFVVPLLAVVGLIVRRKSLDGLYFALSASVLALVCRGIFSAFRGVVFEDLLSTQLFGKMMAFQVLSVVLALIAVYAITHVDKRLGQISAAAVGIGLFIQAQG